MAIRDSAWPESQEDHDHDGAVTLRLADGSHVELRLPSSSVESVRPGDRLSVSVSSGAR